MTLDNPGIIDYLDNMDKESRALKKDLLNITWHMRGGISYSEAMYLSPQERDMIAEIIEYNLQTTKETGLPYF